MSDQLDEAERHCYDMLNFLREQYSKAAQPYIDRLIAIKNVRPRTYVIDGKTFVPIDLAVKT